MKKSWILNPLMVVIMMSASALGLAVESESDQRADKTNAIRLPDAIIGRDYVAPFPLASAEGRIESSFTRGNLPSGLEPVGACMKGTPTQIGEYVFQIRARDELGQTSDAYFAIEVLLPPADPLRISTGRLPDCYSGIPYASRLLAHGGYPPFTWSIEKGALPPGLVLENESITGLVGSEAFEPTEVTLPARVKDRFGTTHSKRLLLRVRSAPPPLLRILMGSLAPSTYLTQYHERLCATGGYPPYTWRIEWQDSRDPDWLELDALSGRMFGTPSRIETRKCSITVEDGLGQTATQSNLLLEVRPRPMEKPLELSPVELPVAVEGLRYQADIFVVGSQGLPQWQVRWEKKPEWLDVEAEGGSLRLRGVPTQPGVWSFRVTVCDSDHPAPSLNNAGYTFGTTGPQHYTITVVESKPPPEPIRLLTRDLPIAQVSYPYTVQLAATGGDGPLRFSGDTSLAPWMTLTENGIISGIPAEPSIANILVCVHDSRGEKSGEIALKVQVIAAFDSSRLQILNFPQPVAFQEQTFAFQLPVAGGVLPYTFSLASEPPPGLAFDPVSGILAGRPRQLGTFSASIEIQDSSPVPNRISQSFDLHVVSKRVANWPVAVSVSAIILGCLLLLLKVGGRFAGRWKNSLLSGR